jgi:hypothetical protein
MTHLRPCYILFLIVQYINKRLCVHLTFHMKRKSTNVDNNLSKHIGTYGFNVI